MPVILQWDGSFLEAPTPTKERTNKGGLFSGIRGEATYFPVAPAYSELLDTVGYYKVPPHFADRPDLIANHLYQSPDYWWVIYWSNKILDPFGRPAAGEVLRVIDIAKLKDLLA